MAGDAANGGSEHVKDLLLEEYRNLADCFWKNEQSGETRVNLFIGLVGAAIGGLATLASAKDGPKGESIRLIAITLLFFLIMLGIVTLFRMLKRNETTDAYKQGADIIRQMFKDYFDDSHILLDYHPFAAGRTTKKSSRKEVPAKRRHEAAPRKIGGLTHTIALINGLLVAGLEGAILFRVNTTKAPLSSLAAIAMACTFCAGVVVQFIYVGRCERIARSRLRKRVLTHAGGVVHRIQDNAIQYLLVGPSVEKPGEWLLPKGHIKENEGHGEAALREVREEAGIAAKLICVAGHAEFVAPSNELVRAKYYLMKTLFETTRDESRRMDWFTFDEARGLLTFETDRYVLARAEMKRLELTEKA